MSNYCIYATLGENEKKMIADAIKEFEKEFGPYIIDVPTEEPHVTVVYGPEYHPTLEEEVTEYHEGRIDTLYPEFEEKFKGLLPSLEYRGVAHFDRPAQDRFIIGLEFNSANLTEMRRHAYNAREDMVKKRESSKEAIMNVAFDKSWDEAPERWIHVTIANVKRDSDIALMQQFVRDKLVKFPSTVNVDEIQMISAVNDIVVPLW